MHLQRKLNKKNSGSHPFESDYAHVEFFLESEKLNADVFITGAFSLWSQDPDYRLGYIEELGGYYGETLMKQGFYDYQYLVSGQGYDPNYFEGNHFETENEYEILVYQYSFQMDVDLLIGYFVMSRNQRY